MSDTYDNDTILALDEARRMKLSFENVRSLCQELERSGIDRGYIVYLVSHYAELLKDEIKK